MPTVTVCHCVGDGYGNPCAGCPGARTPWSPYVPPPRPWHPVYPQPYTEPPPAPPEPYAPRGQGLPPETLEEMLRRLIREELELERQRDE